MKLVIVESPAKARTIEKFLGKDYRVEASYGHIRDLPGSAKEIPKKYRDRTWANMAVDVDNDFSPIYIVPSDAKSRVKELKSLAAKADAILLATDEDREGESISWHLLEVLSPKVPVQRITFHEITRAAIERALESPRDVDDRLVRAQEARRVLDRLYGYSLSPVLWKRVRTRLSAGRVQSVALRLIVEREEERRQFEVSEYWDVVGRLDVGGVDLATALVAVGDQRVASSRDYDGTTGRLKSKTVLVLDREHAERIAEATGAARPWTVSKVERKRTRQRPSPPFITSTLQQAASARLKFAPARTMRLAQRLYEGVDLGGGEREGLITYMRTDSFTLSNKALGDAAALIRSKFGDEYYDEPRFYRTKSRSAQEAHEAIRPTEIGRTPDAVKGRLNADELALYRLIWERTVASQMKDAQLDRTTLELTADVDGTSHIFRATGSILVFPGHLAATRAQREDTILPDLESGQSLGEDDLSTVLGADPRGHETKPPARFTEATLIKKLEEEGIGRPSTYTPIITTIQDREYVVKKAGYLMPTYIGMAVTELLRRHFPQYVDVGFTARLESELDNIATGEEESEQFLARFYGGRDDREGLKDRIDHELPQIDYPRIELFRDPETDEPVRVRIGRNSVFIQRGDGDDGVRVTLPEDLMVDELTPERANEMFVARAKGDVPLGTEPQSGLPIFLKVGPYGPYLQLGVGDGKEKPKRVGLPKETDPESMELDLAQRLVGALPRSLGTDDEGLEITANLGRYGPYVQRQRTFRNLPSLERIFEITKDEALALLASPAGGRKVLKELGAHPETGTELVVLDGRYGPYVTDGSTNASLPKGSDPNDLSLEQAVELLAGKRPRKKVLKELGAHPETGKELVVLEGRYGPYITDGSLNASLPKGSDPDETTIDSAVELLAERAKKGKPKRRRRRK